MQLVLGSMLVARLKAFIQSERKRLDAITVENDATVVGDVEDQEKGEEESDVTVVADVEAQEKGEEEAAEEAR
jgi:hypothetical protein